MIGTIATLAPATTIALAAPTLAGSVDARFRSNNAETVAVSGCEVVLSALANADTRVVAPGGVPFVALSQAGAPACR